MSTFASTATMKLLLNIPSVLTDYDAVLDIVADAVDDIILGELGLSVGTTQTYYEKIDIENATQNEFSVTYRPLVSVTALTISSTLQAESVDYYFKDYGVVRMVPNWYMLPTGREVIEIEYVAGFETIPNDLKYAANLIGVQLFNQQSHIGMDSEKLGGYSYKLASSSGGSAFPNTARMILAKHRRLFARP